MLNAMLKARNKKGFTLMEMLIVVAIIAILVAVSIPIFSSQLETARKATDDANMRAARAVAAVTYLTSDSMTSTTGYYDAEKGTLEATRPANGYGKSKEHKDDYIVVIVYNGTITTGWSMDRSDIQDSL